HDRGAPPGAESADFRRPSNLIRLAPAQGVELLSRGLESRTPSHTVEEELCGLLTHTETALTAAAPTPVADPPAPHPRKTHPLATHTPPTRTAAARTRVGPAVGPSGGPAGPAGYVGPRPLPWRAPPSSWH